MIDYLFEEENLLIVKLLFGQGPSIKSVFNVSSLSVKEKSLVDFYWKRGGASL